jgi:hypothetical protein
MAVVLACACDRAAVTREPPPSITPSGSVAPAAATTPASANACADIRARFNAAHAKRTDTCSADSDCACFNPVGGPQLGCGGVTDAATSKKLGAIEAEFHAASCPWTHNCAAWACAPKCVAGRCSS